MTDFENLFVYGTLKDPPVQQKIIGRTIPVKEDSVEGYTVGSIVIEDKSYPIALQQKGSILKGFVLSVSKEELILLDTYETDAYRRKKVSLVSGAFAWMYVK